jgi:hypothetical protein
MLFASMTYDDFDSGRRTEKREISEEEISEEEISEEETSGEKKGGKKKSKEHDYGEWAYRMPLCAFLQGCGVAVSAGAHGHRGRSDIVFHYKNDNWAAELKVIRRGETSGACADSALEQALAKGCGLRRGDTIILGIAINSSPKVRQITAFKTADSGHLPKDEREGRAPAQSGPEAENEGAGGEGVRDSKP